ncbi:MAG: formyltetrahydrofolate deformylase [Flavobacterium sp.]|jgi:formyltetrahydrofolate deformylase
MLNFDKNTENYILTVQCPAGIGIVAAISGYFSDNHCYICALGQFDSLDNGNFFLRMVFKRQENSPDIEELESEFESVAQVFDMVWHLYTDQQAVKTVIMVSRFDHCLDDLLYRKRHGELNLDITAIVSNHQDCRPMVEREGIRFIHLPIDKDKRNKPEQEQRLLKIVEETGAELVVLARYMQILSDALSKELNGRCINIHHSFLPGFKGASPYRQAFNRGVKVIGATAHYVTSDLDEGPIIEQRLSRVDHNYTPDDLVRIGRDNESMALAKAVKYHIERRVFIDGKKTVIF